THAKVVLVLRLLAQQCLDHGEGFAEAVFSSSRMPTIIEAARQPTERQTVFVRVRTQWSALWQRLNTCQQGTEAGVGSTDLASFVLILSQTAFAQILRIGEPSTVVRTPRRH